MISTIITDIEGTTSSLSFVKDVLFPYAKSHLTEYVRAHQSRQDLQVILDDVRAEVGDSDLHNEAVIRQLLQWIDEDKKITPLKTLQGLIWEAGYHNGDFYGHVYQDAVEKLREWRQQGLSLYVYSSGSVYAQKLLFAHTEHGDLCPLFAGYFDTQVGGKKTVEAYVEIARQLNKHPAELLFLSDVVEELDAAEKAGWFTLQLTRPGEAQAVGGHPTAGDFSEIDLSCFV